MRETRSERGAVVNGRCEQQFLEIFHLDISLKIHSKASILVDTNEWSSSCLAKDSFERRRRSEKLIRQTELFVRSKKIT